MSSADRMVRGGMLRAGSQSECERCRQAAKERDMPAQAALAADRPVQNSPKRTAGTMCSGSKSTSSNSGVSVVPQPIPIAEAAFPALSVSKDSRD